MNQLPVKSKKKRQKKLEMEVGIVDMGGALSVSYTHLDVYKRQMQAYGLSVKDTSEAQCVAELMRLYQKLVSNLDS